MINISHKLKELRKKYNISQSELSTELGISIKELKDIENNNCDISMNLLLSISKIFDVSLNYFLLEEVNNKLEDIKEIFDSEEKVDNKFREILYNISNIDEIMKIEKLME